MDSHTEGSSNKVAIFHILTYRPYSRTTAKRGGAVWSLG